MRHEPLPIFDCVYCSKDSKLVFQKLSEKVIQNKYSRNRQESLYTLSDNFTDNEVTRILHTSLRPADEILITDEWHLGPAESLKQAIFLRDI